MGLGVMSTKTISEELFQDIIHTSIKQGYLTAIKELDDYLAKLTDGSNRLALIAVGEARFYLMERYEQEYAKKN